MRNKRIAAVLLALAAVVLASLAAGSAGAAKTATAGYKVAFVTDTAGLNDKSFNHLGNLGREKAQKDLGLDTKVYVSNSESDYLPNAVAAQQWGAKAVVMNGFLLSDAPEHGGEAVPGRQVRDHRLPARRTHRQAGERVRPDLQVRAVRLSRRLPRRRDDQGAERPEREAEEQQDRPERRRREEDPVGRQLDRRLPRRRQGVRQEREGPDRLLERLHAGDGAEVQGARAQAHLARVPRRSSRSPVAAASVPCRPRSRRRSGASASTPTSPTSARTS